MIATCLWFDGRAEEAAAFYTGLFPKASIDRVMRAPMDYPAGKAGDALLVEFTLDGRAFQGLNGGAGHLFTDAVSIAVTTPDQAETDRLWDALVADGGAEIMCGWCRDRFGLSWQIVPAGFLALIGDPDPGRAARAMAAMMGMRKLDLAALRAAADAA